MEGFEEILNRWLEGRTDLADYLEERGFDTFDDAVEAWLIEHTD